MKITEFQEVATVDLYYICQVIDRITSDPFPWLRNIEDIFGDAASASLTRSYPKWTCFHEFIESCITSIAWEQAGHRSAVVKNGLWVDHLFAANNFDLSYEVFLDNEGPRNVGDYLTSLNATGDLQLLTEIVAKQVFHVLFSNRLTLSRFAEMVSWYVRETAPSFSPSSFGPNWSLVRKRPPVWVTEAVIHRDKGMCVNCRVDLTKVTNRRATVHFDHIVPLKLGGMNCITNLQILCDSCNLVKGSSKAFTSPQYESWYHYS